jgi:predicted transcriptional regulator
MGESTPRVTDAELAVLQVLWRRPGSTVREIAVEIYPAADPTHNATVHKLLERLEAKRLIARERAAPAHRFTATVERDYLIGGELQDLAERLCEGSLTPVLTHLAGNVKLTARERELLRRLLDEAPKRKGAES